MLPRSRDQRSARWYAVTAAARGDVVLQRGGHVVSTWRASAITTHQVGSAHHAQPRRTQRLAQNQPTGWLEADPASGGLVVVIGSSLARYSRAPRGAVARWLRSSRAARSLRSRFGPGPGAVARCAACSHVVADDIAGTAIKGGSEVGGHRLPDDTAQQGCGWPVVASTTACDPRGESTV